MKILIPIYQAQLPKHETLLLYHNLNILSKHEVIIIAPENLDISDITTSLNHPQLSITRVSNEWLGKKNGINGYNQMMLSSDFYSLFADTDYILICQTDAVIFRDELTQWCNKGYDYIGAPWVKSPFYNTPLGKAYLSLKRLFSKTNTLFSRQDLYEQVGNGGLSLRKVNTMIQCCNNYKDEITQFLSQQHNLFNEDVFWAMIPKIHKPNADTALQFAFDTRPKECYRRTNHQLPFGAHAITKPRYINFWRSIIPQLLP